MPEILKNHYLHIGAAFTAGFALGAFFMHMRMPSAPAMLPDPTPRT